MIELAQHIDSLLLENDCVIIPGFGGFVAHYTCATYIKEENLFLPPVRNIGFTPQLKINDGVLAQSFMSAYGTNFTDATRRIEKEVNELIDLLHTEGKVRLDNIGELIYNINGDYDFVPCANKPVTPSLYGFDSFEICELSLVRQKELPLIPMDVKKEKKTYEIHINRNLIRNAVAVAAVIILFFAFSTPVENTYVQKNNYAQLMPNELFEQIVERSVAMTPIANLNTPKSKALTVKDKTQHKTVNHKSKVTPISTREIKVARQAEKPQVKTTATVKPKVVAQPYHIIVAGGISLNNAKSLAARLKAEGFSNAQVLTDDGKIRVSVYSFDNREEANRQLLKLRERDYYADAWLLIK